MLETRRVRLHQLDGRPQRVRDVHHVELGVRRQKAGVVLAPRGVHEDVDRPVGGASSRRRRVGHDPRVPQPSHVDAVPEVVVVAEKLAADLRHPIHRRRALHGVLRRPVRGRRRPERRDRRGNEDRQLLVARHLQHRYRAAHVHLVGELRIPLADGRKNGREVVDAVGLESHGRRAHCAGVGRIEDLERSRPHVVLAGRADVGGEHAVGAVPFTEGRDELRADLAAGSGDEDSGHVEEGCGSRETTRLDCIRPNDVSDPRVGSPRGHGPVRRRVPRSRAASRRRTRDR